MILCDYIYHTTSLGGITRCAPPASTPRRRAETPHLQEREQLTDGQAPPPAGPEGPAGPAWASSSYFTGLAAW